MTDCTKISELMRILPEAQQVIGLLMYALDQASPELLAALEIAEDAISNRDCASCYWTMTERHEFPCSECRDGMNWTKKVAPDNGVEPCRKEQHEAASEIEALRAADLRGAQLLMVGSQLADDPKMDHRDCSDPRWTPTLHEAWVMCEENKRLKVAIEGYRRDIDNCIAELRHKNKVIYDRNIEER